MMASAAMLLLCVIVGLATAPRLSLAGRIWHDGLVQPLVRRLSAVTSGHVAMSLGIAGFFGLLVWLMGAEGLHLSSMALPEVANWAMTFEISTLLDAAVVVVALSAAARIKSAGGWLMARLRVKLPRTLSRAGGGRRASGSRSGARLSAANDDDPHGRVLVA